MEELTNQLNARPATGGIVTLSNALARAAHGLNLSEKRVVMIAVTKMGKNPKVDQYGLVRSRVMASDLSELADVDVSVAYKQLRAAAKVLYERSICFFQASYNRKGKPIEPTKVHMRWVTTAHYHQNEAWVEIAWNPEVLPHLLGLQKQFTKYRLHQTGAMRSMHSWKLLELLTRFESSGWAEYTVEDFCESMEATPNQRKDFDKIRTRIIQPAVRELTEKDGWDIEWSTKKQGRKVGSIRFVFRRSPQGSLF